MRVRRQPPADLETIIPLLIGQWRRTLQIAGPAEQLQTREFRSVVAEISALQEGLFTGSSLFGEDYFGTKERLGAYTLYHWLIHYQQGLSLINELPETPHRVLDICAGPCSFAFAALRHGATDVTAIDRSVSALQWGAQLCGRYGMPLTIRDGKIDSRLCGVQGQFDLIIVGHALWEVYPDEDKVHAFVETLLTRLAPQGHLLIVDSSYPAVNKKLLALRDHVVARGSAIRAPCIWRGPCPVRARGDSPCFAQRPMEKPSFIKEVQRAASINLSSLKMSYLIICGEGEPWPDTRDEKLYRVISPPFDGHYGTTFYLCGVDGLKKLAAVPSSLPESAAPFRYLKRGELLAVDNAAVRGTTLEVVEGTALRVIAACGKAWHLS